MANEIKYRVNFQVQKQALKDLKSQLQQLQKIKISDVMKVDGSTYSQAKETFMKIRQDAGQVEMALQKAFNPKLNTVNLQTFNSALAASGRSISSIYQNFSKAGATGQAAFRNLSTQILRTNVQMKQSHALLDKMAQTLGNTIKWNISSAAVNGLTRSVEQAWGYVKSLDTSLNDIRIVTGKSADEMANFAVQANNAAKELGKTTTDYTNAALIYAQQGLSDEEVEARARITLKAANVTGQSTDAVSEQLTAVWNGYKVTAEQAELYVDRLAAVAATTASDLQELSTGMSKVASAANAMGVGQDQLAAQLSTIISATKQAPESVGTALRTVYARISDIKAGIDEDGVTLGNYSGRMASLGINVLDTAGNLRDMGEVMEEIGGKWATMTREQQVYLAQTMAGQRQYNNLLALFDNFQNYTKALDTARNAAGTLQEQQDIYMDSTKAHLQTLKASVEDVYDSFVNQDALESVNDLIDALSSGASVIAKFIDSVGGGANILKSLGAIGITVFSKQIAGSIQTTIHNMNLAKQQAQQMQDKIQQAQTLKDAGSENQYTKYMLENQQQLLKNGSRMSPEDFQGMQDHLQQFTNAANEVDAAKEKVNSLELAFQSVGKKMENLTAGYGGLSNMLKSDTGVQSAKQALTTLQKTYDPIIKKQEELAISFANMANKQAQGHGDNSGISGQLTQFKKDIDSLVEKLKETKIGQSDKTIFSNLSEKIQKEIQDANKKIQEINLGSGSDKDRAESIRKIREYYQSIIGNLTAEQKKVLAAVTAAQQGTLEQQQQIIKESTQKMEQHKKTIEAGMEQTSKRINIENITKMIGGLTQVGAGIKQIQGLGSIWVSSDIDTGQKLSQTFANLTMTLPMLISGVKTLIPTLTSLSTALGFTSLLNPFTGIIAAAAIAVTAIMTVTAAQKQLREETIKTNNETIESANKKQQQINANKQLASSLEELNEQYKNGEITRAELRTSIQNLGGEYDLEQSRINRLSTAYQNLTAQIQNFKAENANKEFANAQQGYDAAKQNFQIQAETSGEKYTANKWYDAASDQEMYSTSLDMSDISEQVTDYIMQYIENSDIGKEMQITNMAGTLSFDFEYDDSKIREFMNILEQAYQDVYSANFTKEQRENLTSSGTANYLKDNRQTSQTFDQFTEATQGAAAARVLSDFDFSSIQDAASYTDVYKQALEAVQVEIDKAKQKQEEWAKTANAEDITKSFFQGNFTDAFNQFDDAASYFIEKGDELGKNFSQKFIDRTKDLVSQLDERQFQELLKVDPKNWKQLYDTALKLSKIDFSYTKEAVSEDFQGAQLKAVDQYTKYQQVQDKVSQGKNLSSKQLEELPLELQTYFTELANGQQKMTGDAKEFNQLVNNLKLDGFKSILSSLQEQANRLSSYVEQGLDKFNYEELNQGAITNYSQQQIDAAKNGIAGGPSIQTINSSIDADILNQQLEYLDIIGDTDAALQQQVDKWREIYDGENATIQLAEEIADKVSEVGDRTQGLKQKQAETAEQILEIQHQIYDAMFPTDSDIDTGALSELSETIQDIADESEQLDDSLTSNSRSAEDVAEAILRFDDAIQDVVDNYDDWMKALKSGSIQEQAEAIAGLRDAYADLLDLDGSSLSEEFLTSTENLNLMKAAIDGDVEAYNQLMELAGQDILVGLGLSDEDALTKFQDDLNWLQSYDSSVFGNIADLAVGAELKDEDFLNSLTDMVNAAGMTAQQATDYLASMGVDAEVIEQDTKTQESNEAIQWESKVTPHQVTSTDQVLSMAGDTPTPTEVTTSVTEWSQEVSPIVIPGTATKENKAFSLRVTSANKSSGGGFKFKQASNGGGSKGTTRRAGTGGKGGGSKGGGGGGKGKSSSPKKAKPTDPFKDEIDRYHDINIQLSETQRDLDRIQKVQERLYGKDLIKNLNDQSKILEKHKKLLRQKNDLQIKHLEQIRNQLEKYGIQFEKDAEINDKLNDISNYMTILSEKQKYINALITERNQLQQAYVDAQNTGNEDLAGYLGYLLELKDEEIDKQKESYDELNKQIEKYDDINEKIAEINDQLDEQTRKQVELNIQKFRMSVEIRLELGEAERQWNQFRRKVLEHTDLLQQNSGEQIYRDALQAGRNVESYYNIGGSRTGELESLTKQLQLTKAEVDKIDRGMTSAIYGDDKAAAMEHLKEDLSNLMTALEDIESLTDEVGQAYLDSIDDADEKFNEQIESLEFVGELLQHDMDLLNLVYGEKNYDAMDKYYTSMEENNLKQVESLKEQTELWRRQWDAAVAAGDTAAAKSFEQKYKKALSNLNSKIEESAQLLRDQYLNSVNKIFDQLDKKVTGGKGSDYLTIEWQLQNKNDDEYLDTINAAFAEQDIIAKYQKAIDATSSIKSQRALKDLMEQQVELLKQKEKLTQYDVERAEKLLQVEQARIALQDTQAAKTQMRLRHDSQGNYSYQFVADEEAAADAIDKLAAAQNDLYNFDKERYNQNLSDMLSAWKDFQSQYKEIIEDTAITEEQRVERLALVRDQYNEYITGKAEQVADTRKNLQESSLIDMLALNEQYIQDRQSRENEAQGVRQKIINEYYQKLKDAYGEDVENFNEMTTANQTSFADLATNILIKLNQELIPNWNVGVNTMAETFNGEKDGKKGLIPQCEDGFKNLTKAGDDYQKNLKIMVDKAGKNLKEIKDGEDDLAKSMGNAVIKSDELTTAMGNQITKAHQLYVWVKNLKGEYEGVGKAAKDAAKDIQDFITQQDLQAAKDAQQERDNLATQPETPAPQNETPAPTSEPEPIAQSQPQEGQPFDLFSWLASPEGKAWDWSMIESAYHRINSGAWGVNPVRIEDGLNQGYGLEQIQKAQELINRTYPTYLKGMGQSWEEAKKAMGYRTGGYTGNWPGVDGRIAMLHQKELVLNQSDTKNLLDTIGILRSVMSSLGGAMTARLSDIKSGYSNAFNSNSEIDQNVHIEASFPNVDSKRQIEEAFNDLVNLAAQRALR